MGWFLRGNRFYISTNCTGVVATIALTVVIFATLLILKYASPLPTAHKGRVREYYIAAEEVQWNYTPLYTDPMTGAHWNGGIIHGGRKRDLGTPYAPYVHYDLDMSVAALPNRIGPIYRKARYVEYESETFTTKKARPASEFYLGLLGPIIRAEVGDLVRVYFMNRATFNASIHPHALFYFREDEGMPMGGNASGIHNQHRAARQFGNHAQHDQPKNPGLKIPPISAGRGDGSIVAPGSTHIYEWQVPVRAGPGDKDGSSVVWWYHSHVDETRDINTGLMGPIVITAQGRTRSGDDPRPKDVDVEFILALTRIDEGVSHLLNKSMEILDLNGTEWQTLMADPEFSESNVKSAINGYLYNNMLGLSMTANETVRWHLLSIGDEKDLHGAHFLGATLLQQGSRTDSIDLLPGTTRSADMVPDVLGQWMVHCHSSKHVKRGMSATYFVAGCGNHPCPVTR